MPPSPELSKKMAEVFISLTSDLKNESDRGCVILGIAWIEEQLTELLVGYCLHPEGGKRQGDEVFGVSGPVGTFAAKIDIAYRLGLIRPHVKKCLHLCRKVRNDFAHRSSHLAFQTTSVRDRVLEMFKLNELVLGTIWELVKRQWDYQGLAPVPEDKGVIHALESALGTRELFHWTVGLIVIGLIRAAGEVERIQPLSE